MLNNFIGDKKYIVGNHLTVPDLSLFASVSYLEWMDVKFNEFSHIKNWYHRIQNEHQYVNEIVTKFDKFDELKAYLQNDPRPRIRAFAKAFGKKNN